LFEGLIWYKSGFEVRRKIIGLTDFFKFIHLDSFYEENVEIECFGGCVFHFVFFRVAEKTRRVEKG
jgi:hypothetical protein